MRTSRRALELPTDPQGPSQGALDGVRKELLKRRRLFTSPRPEVTNEGIIVSRARKRDCVACAFKCV